MALGIVTDLGALGNHPGSPFLPSDSEIMLGSSEHEDIGNGVSKYIFTLIPVLVNSFKRKDAAID